MRKPPKEVLEELAQEPYKYYDGVDYRRIMSLKIPAIKIDSRNEKMLHDSKMEKKKEQQGLANQLKLEKQLLSGQTKKNQDMSDSEEEKTSNASNEEFAGDGFDLAQNNLVYVCALIIDIEIITKQQILKLRKMMPKKDYRQLKNRKSARECRKKRKAERFGMINELEDLRQKNRSLHDELKQLRSQVAQKNVSQGFDSNSEQNKSTRNTTQQSCSLPVQMVKPKIQTPNLKRQDNLSPEMHRQDLNHVYKYNDTDSSGESKLQRIQKAADSDHNLQFYQKLLSKSTQQGTGPQKLVPGFCMKSSQQTSQNQSINNLRELLRSSNGQQKPRLPEKKSDAQSHDLQMKVEYFDRILKNHQAMQVQQLQEQLLQRQINQPDQNQFQQDPFQLMQHLQQSQQHSVDQNIVEQQKSLNLLQQYQQSQDIQKQEIINALKTQYNLNFQNFTQ